MIRPDFVATPGPGEYVVPAAQIATLEQARAAGEAALMAPSTRRSEWVDGNGTTSVNYAVTEPGATFSAVFMAPDLDENRTCLIIETQTPQSNGTVVRRAFASDFGTMVALPKHNPQTGQFGVRGQEGLQAVRDGRHQGSAVSKDLVVGQSLFGKAGEEVVTAVVVPAAALNHPSRVFERIKYDGDGNVALSAHGQVPRNMKATRHNTPNPVVSALGHLNRVKARYEQLERDASASAGSLAIK